MGDEQEAYWIDDPRYTPPTLETSPLKQQSRVVLDLEPLAKVNKLITILYGNHSHHLYPKVGDITEKTCEDLHILYGGFSCVVNFIDDYGSQFKGFFTHGRKLIRSIADDPIRRYANEKLQLKQHLKYKFGDCILMAKGHCLSEDTEILTRFGWKKHDQILENDLILTFNIKSSIAEWQKIDAIYKYENKYQTMLECNTSKVSICVTDEHRIITKFGKKGWGERPAQECSELSLITIPVSGIGPTVDYQISDGHIQLMGWLISEGHFRSNGAVQIFQSVSRAEPIRQLLNRLGLKFSEYRRPFSGREFTCRGKTYKTKEDCISFYIWKDSSKEILKIISKKQIPDFALDFSNRQFELFLFTMVAGDGCWQKNGRLRSGYYFTSDPILADQLQALCVSHGWKAYISVRKNGNGIAVGIIKQSDTNIGIDQYKKLSPWKKVEATSIVWCVSVPNGTIFTRRHGKVCVLGNTHKLIISKPESQLYLTTEENMIDQHYTNCGGSAYIHPDNRWYVNTGSFLKTFAEDIISYSEIGEYDPVELGYAVVEVNNREITNIRKVVV